MSDTEQEIKHHTQLGHVKARPNMYIGSTKVQTVEMYVLQDDEFRLTKLQFSPALYKIVDEIIVNAIDRYTSYPKKVTRIAISFDIDSGKITVKNDGPGIPIKKIETNTGELMYQPQVCFAVFLAGSNFDDEKVDQRIVGGQNGIGAKATNAFSKLFRVETRYKKKLYKQKFKNRLEEIEEPVITDSDGPDYTKISFVPAYDALGYEKFTEENRKDLLMLLKSRAYYAAAFVDCAVSFNDEDIELESFEDFAKLFVPQSLIYSTVLKNEDDKKMKLEICIAPSDGKSRNVSLINGISVYLGGNHIKYIRDRISDAVKPFVEKLIKSNKSEKTFKSTIVANQLFIFVKGLIPNPEFNSQSKESLTNPIEQFAGYQFSKKDVKEIWNLLEVPLTESLVNKAQDKKTRTNRKHVILEKGEDARYAGSKTKAKQCSLFICEGDSAMGLIRHGVNDPQTELSWDYYGVISIQGVPINARKETVLKKHPSNGEVIKIRTAKLKNNKRIQDLVKVLGLDYSKTYTTDAELETLRYGRVVVAVDQDVDGKGQIFGLIMNFFLWFWPALIEKQYITRLNTPIIRAAPQNKKLKYVQEFYSLGQFDAWVEKTYKNDHIKLQKDYDVKYYKGLGSHDKPEIFPIFDNFEDNLLQFVCDKKAQETFEIYFGVESEKRKKEFRNNIVIEEDYKEDEYQIECSRMAKTDVREFQRENILRKLPHSIDGLIPVRRKVLAGLREIFTHDKVKGDKVFVLASKVTSSMHYQHGDASINNTIITMAQSFVGARNIPYVIGYGGFGNRNGETAASPRYICAKLNFELTEALFPRCDDFLLKYVFEDGQRVEPLYYVPVLPTAVLETMILPATGWKIEIWARDYKNVIANVKKMVKMEIDKCKKLRIWLRDSICDIRYMSDNSYYIVGKYKYDKDTNTVTVIDLPPGIKTNRYKRSVAYGVSMDDDDDDDKKKSKKDDDDDHDNDEKKKTKSKDKESKSKKLAVKDYRKGIKHAVDESNYEWETNKDTVCVKFELTAGTMDKWKSVDLGPDHPFDNVEKELKLYKKISSHINLIKPDNTVREYKYESTVVNDWFIERKKLYQLRIDRLIVLTRMRIILLENTIRFAKEHEKYGINKRPPESEFIAILEKNKYVKIDRTLLNNPKHTKADELEKLIIDGPNASYNYIIDLSFRQLLDEASAKREKELKAEKNKLAEYLDDVHEDETHFKGQKTWLKEIDEVEKILDVGVKEGWKHNDPKLVFKPRSKSKKSK